ncbi:galactoside alpha-(1,2)-fucosyltransferase 2-like [Ornithodoros turicata]|uniref:galactoside alpha-(1,2)-fucosyltransferase 2-like n=1 Tax=Ornithodoros turicata TaxID=34597 RepID=UPI003138CEFE
MLSGKLCLLYLLAVGIIIYMAYNLTTPAFDLHGVDPYEDTTWPPGPGDATVAKGAWTTHNGGRLGNQMGGYAALYALAKVNQRLAYVHPDMHIVLTRYFRITLPVIERKALQTMNWTFYTLEDRMNEHYAHIHDPYVWFQGFPCSWTFYHSIREEIVKEFTFHEHIRDKAWKTLQGLRGNRTTQPVFVGIHVRRGDYVRVMHERYRGVVADKTYFQRATGYFRSRYKELIFVVVSSDIAWCKENIDASLGDIYFPGDGDEIFPGDDLALLVQCNHTIVTLGTFGYWAGYLAGGEVVYLANFTLPDSPMLNFFFPPAAYLPEWVGIEADLSPVLRRNAEVGSDNTLFNISVIL